VRRFSDLTALSVVAPKGPVIMISRFLLAASLVIFGLQGTALAVGDDIKLYQSKGAYSDIRQNLEDAIIDRGLVINLKGNIGEMLDRTGSTLGKTNKIYANAEFFSFCSAKLSRKMVEADPHNMGYCPYNVFVYELTSEPGTVHVGYRKPLIRGSQASKAALLSIDEFLDEVVQEAAEQPSN
jgi:uncharacterized protein (DUF302 family)